MTVVITNTRTVNIVNAEGNIVDTISNEDAVATIPAGTYTIVNATAGENEVQVASISLTANGGSTPVEPEDPTEEPTEATTEEATEATTAGTEEPSEEPTDIATLDDEYVALSDGLTLTGGDHQVIVESEPTNAGVLTVGEDMEWKTSTNGDPVYVQDEDGNTYKFAGW